MNLKLANGNTGLDEFNCRWVSDRNPDRRDVDDVHEHLDNQRKGVNFPL